MGLTLGTRGSGTRISGLGTTVGIVGGCHRSGSSRGCSQSLMMSIVAVTTISSFAIPSYELGVGFSEFILIACAVLGFMELYWVIVLLTH